MISCSSRFIVQSSSFSNLSLYIQWVRILDDIVGLARYKKHSRIMNIGAMMCTQIIPDEYAVRVSAWDIVGFWLSIRLPQRNIELRETVVGCPSCTRASFTSRYQTRILCCHHGSCVARRAGAAQADGSVQDPFEPLPQDQQGPQA